MAKKLKAVKRDEDKLKGKKKNQEDECLSVIGQYFGTRMTATNKATSNSSQSEDSTRVAEDEDELFCKMLAKEMRKVNSSAIKRGLKRKLMDACFAAQEQEEAAQTQFYMVTTDGSVVPQTATTNVTNEGSSVSADDADLLLQWQSACAAMQ